MRLKKGQSKAATTLNITMVLLTWHEADSAGGHHGSRRVQGRKGHEEEDGKADDVEGFEGHDDGQCFDARTTGVTHDAHAQGAQERHEFRAQEREKNAPTDDSSSSQLLRFNQKSPVRI